MVPWQAVDCGAHELGVESSCVVVLLGGLVAVHECRRKLK